MEAVLPGRGKITHFGDGKVCLVDQDKTKTSPSKCKFSDLRLRSWKLTKFLMSFFKPPVKDCINLQKYFLHRLNQLVAFSSDIIYFG